jgi:putative phosphoesterase
MSTIGVVADTHDEVVPWGPVRERLGAAFAGVSLVVHCGDATSAAVLDGLAEIAPVVAVRSAADPPPDPPRLVDGPRVVEHDGIAVGVVATLPADADLVTLFGRPVRLVLHGGTHAPAIEDRGDTLLVNPGSPTLAERPTAALVAITAPDLTATIVEV